MASIPATHKQSPPVQGMEAGTGETEGLDAKRDSPVSEADAPKSSAQETGLTESETTNG